MALDSPQMIPSKGIRKKWLFIAVPLLIVASAAVRTGVWGGDVGRRIVIDLAVGTGVFVMLALARALYKAFEAWHYIGHLPYYEPESYGLHYAAPSKISNLMHGGQVTWGYRYKKGAEPTPLCKWLTMSVLYSIIYPRNDKDDAPMNPK